MTGDSEFSFSYWNWLKATNRDLDTLFSNDRLGSIDVNGVVSADSKYGINNGWNLVCLYDEDNDRRFRDVCDPTESSDAEGLTRLQRCQKKEDCMPEQNPQWPSLADTRKAINEMNNYRRSPNNNNIFNKHNTESFSNYLEGWDPRPDLKDECLRDKSSRDPKLLCGEDDNIPRRLHNSVRTTFTKYTH